MFFIERKKSVAMNKHYIYCVESFAWSPYANGWWLFLSIIAICISMTFNLYLREGKFANLSCNLHLLEKVIWVFFYVVGGVEQCGGCIAYRGFSPVALNYALSRCKNNDAPGNMQTFWRYAMMTRCVTKLTQSFPGHHHAFPVIN